MEKKEYEILFELEDDYWWYKELRGLVFSLIDKTFPDKNGVRLLDAGCGTGGFLARCSGYDVYGFDISEESIKFCKIRKLRNILRASVSNIPFSSHSFDLVISLDVLYHLGVENDGIALKEFYRVLAKGGVLVMNLPAYNFLKSMHDTAIHTKRRYIRQELKRKTENAGFKIEKITYRNAILFPFILPVRLFEKLSLKSKKRARSDLKRMPDHLNKLLTSFLSIENRLIRSGLNFPFGLSLFCVAVKE
jgi:SAM-dependent methyltransferase